MKFYFNHRLAVDFSIGASAAAIVYFQPLGRLGLFRWPAGSSLEAFVLAISAASATMVGFVLAASTFLITHTAHERFAILRASAGYEQLLAIVRSTMWRLFVLTGASGSAVLINPSYAREALAAVALILTVSVLGLATLIWSTLSILSIQLVDGSKK